MNRAERIFHLHRLLKARQPPSLSRLMEELNASRATINRDLEYMRLFMGAPIVYDRNTNGYRYDPAAPEFELPGLWFNHSELHALLACEQLLEEVQPGLLSPYIGPLRARIRKLLGQGGASAETVRARVLLRSIARRGVNAESFGTVASAVLGQRQIRIDYTGREREETTTRTVHPQRLVRYRDNWYLVAWCETAGNPRIFSLDRIETAHPTDEPARDLPADGLDRFMNASFGIFSGEARAWAVLRFTAHAARWIENETWHPDQIGQWHGDSYELQVPYSDPRELLMDILKYGPEVEVLAPRELRRETAERLRAAAARYQTMT
ncbi:helix-turn-helix transcriptional regulator [Pseudothauera rhizosphaerae]|uniref:YafY family transcriptional regulator n=1 Tax=Pseudothauera rhizosphaerae TaxID=2565932 RepID=A0A4S4AML7_9RHOO|nr:YafY family protein [Pseudothauera rhizosphaerae]THF60398.1 YafY family transcriptional regulator [Pseudothauera rhizosphaerae]